MEKKNKVNQINDFYKRWNIELDEKEIWINFKKRFLNTFTKHLEFKVLHNEEIEREFLEFVGEHHKKESSLIDPVGFDKKLSENHVYLYFYLQTDFKMFFLGVQALFSIDTIGQGIKDVLYKDLLDIISLTGVQIAIKKAKKDIIVYPKGAKILDEKLVNDALDWLVQYPKIYEKYKLALSYVDVQGKERIVLDNLRFAFELLLKEKLGNRKSLENQKEELGKFLKFQIQSTEISNLFWKVYDFYLKYQNENVKHSENINKNEVEFMLYQTGILLRFILRE
ncbi:hypothetical protein MKS83_14485 [Chryseobacterium sp. Y16C]|uniref:hypothetical protein n=1 Tax=Chryseobacterium sp. Y16C TaxID=2920939 RepID=UPI001F0A526E|nr:hypothetical protein [Chryseobacterium sp. Y16C]UMQ40602.1 hypothetical protein MKS83_14485 [Chryseobacterium sp. Y16C]